MSKRSAEVLIEDMLEAVAKVARFTEGMTHETFIADDKTVDAVVRNLEIIGEAAKRLPDEFKAGQPHVEWRKIVGLRNRVVHDYFGIDLEIIWHVIKTDLPVLQNQLSLL